MTNRDSRCPLRIALAPEVEGELVPVEGNDRDQDEEEQWHQLGDGRDDVDERRLLDALQDQGMNEPQADRGADNRGRLLPSPKNGKEIGQGREYRDRIGDVAEEGADPVAPGTVEADEIAEACLGISIGTGIEIRLSDGKALIDEGQHQHADARDDPADEDRARRRATRHVARQIEDAAADHRADDQGYERHKCQFL